MKNLFLRLLACLLVAAMLISTLSVAAIADADGAAPEDTTQTDDSQTDAAAEPAEGEAEADETDEAAEPAEGEETAPAEGEEVPAEGGEAAPAEGEEAAPADGEEAPAEEEVDAPLAKITDEEALANCQIAAENDRFILYYDEGLVAEKEGDDPEPTMERVGIYDKQTGIVYWTNPINAMADDATDRDNLRENRLSNLAFKYGNATDLIMSSAFLFSYRQSTSRGNTKMEPTDDGIKITYRLQTASAIVPVYIKLHDDYFEVVVNTKEIKENNGYKEGEDAEESSSDVIILTELALMPYLGATEPGEEGYMLIPDGSGALINYNNGKGVYADYSQTIYGRDITQVREVEPDMTEQAYLPVMATVNGNNGLVMIASEGDTFAAANASVAYSKTENSWYNNCYFSFTVRSNDNYYMTGDSSAIIVFEKGDGSIGVDKFAVRYYPVSNDEGEVTTAQIADVYRNYLIEEKGLKKKDSASDPALYIDFYGGTRKSKSILGIPISLKTAYTKFDDAADIVNALSDLGVDNMVVNYNDWSDDSMSAKIDTGDSIASVLGGKGAYKKMLKSFADKGVDYYATVSGITYKSNGNGFWTLFNTAYRASKSYSRQYSYNIAYGTPDTGVAPALLSPRSIPKLSEKVTKSLGKYEQGAGLGVVSDTLWSDFSNKYRTNRCVTAQNVIDYYKAAAESNGKVIASSPNAYLLPYVDRIEDVPLQSSQFKLTDQDVPFYQMVLHGYVDYSTEAVNGAPDTMETVLKAIAAGSNIHYDFIHEEASKLVNTDYVDLYYANYEGWIDEAAKAYKLVNEVLSPAKDATIADYSVDGKVITTEYSNGYVTVVDLEAGSVTAGGKTYNYNDYVKGGLN